MDLRVGDKIICHKPVMVTLGSVEKKYIVTTLNKEYTVVTINSEELYIINDVKLRHPFNLDEYEKWFYNIKHYRKLKLDKINARS